MINFVGKLCNPNKSYVLLGDNNFVKTAVSQKYPNLKVFRSQITHLGEDPTNNDYAILDTLVDFLIIRFSRHVLSFSAYRHGSGFSKQCAALYNIPFQQMFLQPTF